MLTIRSDDHGEHGRPAIGLPREGFPEDWRIIIIASPTVSTPPNAPAAVACTSDRGRRRRGGHVEVHAPGSDPPVLMPRPQQAVGPVYGDAERGRRGHALAEGRALLVAAARARAPLGEHLVERPHPDPGLGPGPELAALRLGGERAEEGARLRLAERVGPYLERGRTSRVHGGAERHTEDALAAPGAYELWEGALAAAVLRHCALERHGALADAAGGASGVGGVGRAGAVLVGRERGVVAHGRHARGIVAERVVEGLGGRQNVLVVEAVVAQRGAARGRGVPRQRLAVGDPAAPLRRGARHLQRLVVRLHGDLIGRAPPIGKPVRVRVRSALALRVLPRAAHVARAAGFFGVGVGVETEERDKTARTGQDGEGEERGEFVAGVRGRGSEGGRRSRGPRRAERGEREKREPRSLRCLSCRVWRART